MVGGCLPCIVGEVLGNMKVHWHVVPVRSWATSTLSTSCCCLHGGHRLLGVIPMPGSSPTLLLAPTSRPSPLSSLPSSATGHGPTRRYRDQRAGRRWRRVGRLGCGGRRANNRRVLSLAVHFVRRVRCMVCCCRS